MDKIVSSTALRDRLSEVKEAARERLVRVTENGAGAFVFCSEEVFEREIENAVESALYVARCEDAIRRGRADVSAGRVVEGVEVGRAAVAALRASRG